MLRKYCTSIDVADFCRRKAQAVEKYENEIICRDTRIASYEKDIKSKSNENAVLSARIETTARKIESIENVLESSKEELYRLRKVEDEAVGLFNFLQQIIHN